MSTVKNWNPFGMTTWIAWLAGSVVGVLTLVAYIFATFETKAAATDHREADQKLMEVNQTVIIQRMDRMENKVDLILQRGK